MILLNILDKAISGGLSALLVFLIYWGVTSLFRRINNGKESISERQNNYISEENQVESKSASRDSIESASSVLPDAKRILVKFNYFYSFKWIPECIEAYNSGNGNIMKVVDVVSINRFHSEFSPISKKIEYALSKHKSTDNIKVIAIAIPNSGAISEVEVGYIVFDEKNQRSIYFTLERSFNGEYAVVSPDAKGNRTIYGTVKNHSAFVELALSIAYKCLEGDKGSQQTNCVSNINKHSEDVIKVETKSSYDYENLTGIAKSRVVGEIA